MNKPTTTLIISTYNWPEALLCTLNSVKLQTLLPNAVIIADDGSKSATKNLIQDLKGVFPVPLVHVWHEDEGFRLAKIRNKAISLSNSEYIIQIDGDVILHKKFIEDHLAYAEKGTYIAGSRVLLNESLSLDAQKKNLLNFTWHNAGIKNRLNAIHFPWLSKLYKTFNFQNPSPVKVRGCNMSYWKEDFLKVNGYNEEIKGWGREDSEFSIRLSNLGLKKQSLKFGGIMYHIHHPINSKNMLKVNDEILRKTIQSKSTFCEKGINQYLK